VSNLKARSGTAPYERAVHTRSDKGSTVGEHTSCFESAVKMIARSYLRASLTGDLQEIARHNLGQGDMPASDLPGSGTPQCAMLVR
jgi:hypothetical protein